jgi:hypothetical protein
MRFRTIALALALACGFTVIGEAKKSNNVVRPAARSHKVKRVKARKGNRAKAKHRTPAKIKHH